MKAVDIIKECALLKGKEIEHELLHDVLELVKECLPKLAAEADEAVVKQVAGIALLVMPVVEPVLEKLIEEA